MPASNSETVELTGSQNLFTGDIDLIGIHDGNSGDVLETLKDLKSEFNGWFKEQIDLLFDTFVDFTSKFEDSKKDELIKIQALGEQSFEDNSSGLSDLIAEPKSKDDTKGKKATVSTQVKIEELNKLDSTISLPFGAIYWKLDSMEKKMGGKKDDDKESKGLANKIKGFLSSLAEGASGFLQLSVALIAFAGATAIFNFVDWGAALVGLVAFAGFVGGMAVLATLLDKGGFLKAFKKMAKTSMYMSAALLLFSVSVLIMSYLPKGVTIGGKEILPPLDIPSALVTLGMFVGFVASIALVSRLLGKEQKNLVEFAKSCIYMTGALLAFSFALVIMTLVGKGLSVLGIGVVDMTVALVTTGVFLLFITAFVGVAILANKFAGDIKQFTITTMLMSASLMIFSVTLFIVSQLMSGKEIKIGDFSLGAFDIMGAIVGVGFFLVFVLAFVGLAILANSFAGNILLFTATTLLMSVSIMLFGLALKTLIWSLSGKDGDFNPLLGLAALEGLVIMAAFVAGYAALGAALTVIAPLVLLTCATLIPVAVSLMLMGAAMGIIAKIIKGGKVKTEEGEEEFSAFDATTVPKFFNAFADVLKNLTSSFNVLDLLKGVAKLALLDMASVLILGLATVLKEIGKVQKDMDESPIRADVFEPFITIIDSLIQVTKDMGLKGAVALVAAGKAMKDIAETIKILFSVVDKATEYDFNGKDKEVLDKAIANMSVLSVKFTDEVFLPTMDRFKHASLRAAKTAESFPLIVNAIAGLVDIIQKVNKMDEVDFDKVNSVFQGLLGVMGIIVGKSAGWDVFGLAREKGLVDILSDAQKKIEKANQVLGSEEEPGPVMKFLKNIASANTFLGKIVKNDFSIEPIQNLVETVKAISGVKMPKILNELEKLSNNNKFEKLAESLNKVADSLEKIKKNMPDKDSLSRIQELTGSKRSRKNVDDNANIAANSDNSIELLNEIRDTLESWSYTSEGTNGRSGIYVSNLDDISVPYDTGRQTAPQRIIKIANAW